MIVDGGRRQLLNVSPYLFGVSGLCIYFHYLTVCFELLGALFPVHPNRTRCTA